MEEYITLQDIDEAVNSIILKTTCKPTIGLILGSGLGELADDIQDPNIIPTTEIPNWPSSTVMGHKGCLVLGFLSGKQVLILQGRSHYYEGYSMGQVALPVRVMLRMGIKTLFVTNAAGGINPDFSPGDVMLITDQLNLIGMAGLNPLRGPNLELFGPRFPDMSQAYDKKLMADARYSARLVGVDLKEGVYACLAGPSFESPADLRFLRLAGADAVGMSTVPEVIAARHGGMSVLGFSGISNKANLDGSTITTHEEVLEAGRIIVPKLKSIIKQLLSGMD